VLKAISAPGQNGITAAGTVADFHGIPLQPVFDKTGLPYSTANIGHSFFNLQMDEFPSCAFWKVDVLFYSCLAENHFLFMFFSSFFPLRIPAFSKSPYLRSNFCGRMGICRLLRNFRFLKPISCQIPRKHFFCWMRMH
jgi:hypothetical protein